MASHLIQSKAKVFIVAYKAQSDLSLLLSQTSYPAFPSPFPSAILIPCCPLNMPRCSDHKICVVCLKCLHGTRLHVFKVFAQNVTFLKRRSLTPYFKFHPSPIPFPCHLKKCKCNIYHLLYFSSFYLFIYFKNKF